MSVADDLAATTQRLKADREHGASYLARTAAMALAAVTAPTDAAADQRLGAIRAQVRPLAEARPSMAAIANTVAAIWSAGASAPKDVDVGGADAQLAQMHTAAEALLARWSEAAERILTCARPLLTSDLFTFSRSGTVEHVLGALAREGTLRHLWVARSFPGDEGLALAEVLASAAHGLEITVVADAACGFFVRQAKAVVVGADSITPDGVVNKVGTYPLALVAQAANVPLYVLCETLKIGVDHVLQIEEMDQSEILSNPAPNITARNPYFEMTPYDLITAIVTEEGVFDRAAIAQRARRTKAALESLPPRAVSMP